MKKQDRQGVRTPADLERKYALGSDENVFGELNNVKQRMLAIEGMIRGELSNIQQSMKEDLFDIFMPVGYVMILWSQDDPNEMFPGTAWTRVKNAFLWACDENGGIGVTGGEKTHALTVSELPVHSHGAVYSGNVNGVKTHAWLASGGSAMAYGTVETGSGAAHNNMPPYVQVAVWRRTE